ncbi:MAG: hypothetical protein ABGX44_06195 [Candidatus Poseidoniia archaeon]
MNGYRVMLTNPTPHTREMTIPSGRNLGVNGDAIRTQNSVTIELKPYSRVAVVYDHHGYRIVDHATIDDIHIIHDDVEIIDIGEGISSRVPIAMESHELNGNKASRDSFLSHARSTYNGVQENQEKRMGGYQLLAQLSYLRSQREEQDIGLYSPEALNLRYDNGVDTIFSHVNAGNISIMSCIGSGYDSAGALQMSVRNNTTRELRVRIPQGCMFEQAEWTGNQNLVVTKEEFVIIGPAKEESFPLHASCANSSAGAPSNDDMNVTPFIFNDLGESFQNQDSVWRSFDGEGGRNTSL